MANFAGLTFAVVPVVTGAGALNTGAVTLGTTMIAAIIDPNSTQRIFNPQAEGNAVASSDNATKWLPVITKFTGTTQVDNYWAPVFVQQTGATSAPKTDVGQVQILLTPAAANVVEASSVLQFYVSPQALLITATGTF